YLTLFMMKTEENKYHLKTRYKKMLADTITPVSIYLQIRDRFSNPILLESSDYHSHENSYSYICFNPMATFTFNNGKVKEVLPFADSRSYAIGEGSRLIDALRLFSQRFSEEKMNFKFNSNGLFGYMQYDTLTA